MIIQTNMTAAAAYSKIITEVSVKESVPGEWYFNLGIKDS